MINMADHLRNDVVLLNIGGMIPMYNPFYKAEAVVFGGTAMAVGGEYSGGGFFILSGKDRGKFFPFTEVAGGASTDIFVGTSVGRVDYTGSSNFRAYMLYGDRHKGWVGFGAVVSGGISGALSKVSGGYIITSEVNAGVGASVILFGFGGNQGTISR
jgi:hypothetical protein